MLVDVNKVLSFVVVVCCCVLLCVVVCLFSHLFSEKNFRNFIQFFIPNIFTFHAFTEIIKDVVIRFKLINVFRECRVTIFK